MFCYYFYHSEKRVIALAAGNQHTCALLNKGHVYCWGENPHLQLGYQGSGSSKPVEIKGVSHASSIIAGEDHNCAIVWRSHLAYVSWEDHKVFAFELNSHCLDRG